MILRSARDLDPLGTASHLDAAIEEAGESSRALGDLAIEALFAGFYAQAYEAGGRCKEASLDAAYFHMSSLDFPASRRSLARADKCGALRVLAAEHALDAAKRGSTPQERLLAVKALGVVAREETTPAGFLPLAREAVAEAQRSGGELVQAEAETVAALLERQAESEGEPPATEEAQVQAETPDSP